MEIEQLGNCNECRYGIVCEKCLDEAYKFLAILVTIISIGILTIIFLIQIFPSAKGEWSVQIGFALIISFFGTLILVKSLQDCMATIYCTDSKELYENFLESHGSFINGVFIYFIGFLNFAFIGFLFSNNLLNEYALILIFFAFIVITALFEKYRSPRFKKKLASRITKRCDAEEKRRAAQGKTEEEIKEKPYAYLMWAFIGGLIFAYLIRRKD